LNKEINISAFVGDNQLIQNTNLAKVREKLSGTLSEDPSSFLVSVGDFKSL
jgi:hypothetical protein